MVVLVLWYALPETYPITNIFPPSTGLFRTDFNTLHDGRFFEENFQHGLTLPYNTIDGYS